MKYRKGHRSPATRLRRSVEALPRASREAMLRGLDSARIIAGGYSDSSSGGICPMLAAHRNGGRTDLSSFARTWDFYTGARRPRLATGREVRTLRTYLESSLNQPEPDTASMAETASRLRAEMARSRKDALVAETIAASRERPATGERDRTSELRDEPRWAWVRPTRRYDIYRSRIAAASEEHSEQRAADVLDGERSEAQPAAAG